MGTERKSRDFSSRQIFFSKWQKERYSRPWGEMERSMTLPPTKPISDFCLEDPPRDVEPRPLGEDNIVVAEEHVIGASFLSQLEVTASHSQTQGQEPATTRRRS